MLLWLALACTDPDAPTCASSKKDAERAWDEVVGHYARKAQLEEPAVGSAESELVNEANRISRRRPRGRHEIMIAR